MPLAREQRKLAAIVAADVVGYSRLMGRDESGMAKTKESCAGAAEIDCGASPMEGWLGCNSGAALSNERVLELDDLLSICPNMNDPTFPTAGKASASVTSDQHSTGLLDRILSRFNQSQTPFEIVFPDGHRRGFGDGPPSFTLTLRNRHALRAFASMDEGRVGDAYVAGHVDIEGDMLRPFEICRSMGDRHYAVTLWRFLQPLLFGQVRTNWKAISDHYDIDADFFLSFLDRDHPMYTQGIFSGPEDTLGAAALRKFDYCYEKLNLKPGDHILEIGPGWGAWFTYASQRGIKCTGLTISKELREYLQRRAAELGHDCPSSTATSWLTRPRRNTTQS